MGVVHGRAVAHDTQRNTGDEVAADSRKRRMVWMDLEMTGLDPDFCTIIEIATIVTDKDLNIIEQGPVLAIQTPEEVLDRMDEWNTTHHGASGLLERVRESTITMAEAERQTLDFLRQHVDERKAPLCGNSIWQDRRFLVPYMRELNEYFHYRNVDVSSIKELMLRWYSNDYLPPKKMTTHRALDDIIESIDELKFYRDHLFVPSDLGDVED
jgi:oligoribonuclease